MKIIRKVVKTSCYTCNKSINGKTVQRNTCQFCNGTGKYSETHYYHIYKEKDGKQYCIDGDTVK